MDVSNDDLQHRCGEVVDRLLAQHRWRLLDRTGFIRRTVAAASEHPVRDIQYLAFGVYNQALYDACSGNEGPLRWEQGYHELSAVLRERARYAYADVWEDVVQHAIEITCKRFKQCEVPQAFVQFAWGHLQNAARRLRHLQNSGKEIPLEHTAHADDQPLVESLYDPTVPIVEQVITDEQRNELHTSLTAFEREHPRAHYQLAAVRLKYLDGKNDEVISQMLGVSVKRVHELRCLGLRKLRIDGRLRRFLRYDDA